MDNESLRIIIENYTKIINLINYIDQYRADIGTIYNGGVFLMNCTIENIKPCENEDKICGSLTYVYGKLKLHNMRNIAIYLSYMLTFDIGVCFRFNDVEFIYHCYNMMWESGNVDCEFKIRNKKIKMNLNKNIDAEINKVKDYFNMLKACK